MGAAVYPSRALRSRRFHRRCSQSHWSGYARTKRVERRASRAVRGLEIQARAGAAAAARGRRARAAPGAPRSSRRPAATTSGTPRGRGERRRGRGRSSAGRPRNSTVDAWRARDGHLVDHHRHRAARARAPPARRAMAPSASASCTPSARARRPARSDRATATLQALGHDEQLDVLRHGARRQVPVARVGRRDDDAPPQRERPPASARREASIDVHSPSDARPRTTSERNSTSETRRAHAYIARASRRCAAMPAPRIASSTWLRRKRSTLPASQPTAARALAPPAEEPPTRTAATSARPTARRRAALAPLSRSRRGGRPCPRSRSPSMRDGVDVACGRRRRARAWGCARRASSPSCLTASMREIVMLAPSCATCSVMVAAFGQGLPAVLVGLGARLPSGSLRGGRRSW